MKKIKKFKVFKILGIVTIIIIICLLAIAIPLHVSEIIAMQECAATPGCMYCVPAKSMVAVFMYFISFILLNIAIVFFILYNTVKKKNI